MKTGSISRKIAFASSVGCSRRLARWKSVTPSWRFQLADAGGDGRLRDAEFLGRLYRRLATHHRAEDLEQAQRDVVLAVDLHRFRPQMESCPASTVPSAMATAACVGSMTGMPSLCSSGARWTAMPAQPRTIDPGAVRAKEAADLHQPAEGRLAAGTLVDAHPQRPLPRETVRDAHPPEIAQMPGDRGLGDGDDAEAIAAGERRQDPRLLNAEDRDLRHRPAGVDAGIGIAGDDEGRGVRAGFDQPHQRQDDAVDVELALDAERAFGERQAFDRRAAAEPEGLKRPVEPGGDGGVGVRVDDDNRTSAAGVCAHGAILAPKFLAGSSSGAR